MAKWGLGPLFFSCLLAAACGGGSPLPTPSPGGGGNPGQEVVLRGGERLAWDQPADSVQAVRTYTFLLYVDGAPATLADTGCTDVRSAAGYACSGRLPALAAGRHSLELSAFASGRESTRSLPLLVRVNSSLSQTGPSTNDVTSAIAASATGALICLDAASVECYNTRLIAAGLGSVTALVPTTTGQTFLVEDAERIRVVIENRLIDAPALTLDAVGSRITGVSVPPDFQRSRAVYVAWSEPSRDGGEALNITRYRELRGTLGEGATIVTGLPLPSGGLTPMAVDDEGLLYVALPGMGEGDRAASATALNNFILRFDRDGSVPNTNPQPTPVLAHGYANPSALIWDAVGKQLWLAGADPRLRSPVVALPVESGDRGDWPMTPVAVLQGAPDGSTVGPLMALTTEQVASRERKLWLLAKPGEVYRTLLQSSHTLLQFDKIGVDAIGSVTALADGPGRRLTLVTRSEESSRIWQLTARPPLTGSK